MKYLHMGHKIFPVPSKMTHLLPMEFRNRSSSLLQHPSSATLLQHPSSTLGPSGFLEHLNSGCSFQQLSSQCPFL
jgi:hypothetical protein